MQGQCRGVSSTSRPSSGGVWFSGPWVLFPLSKRRHVRPGELEHAIVKKYLQPFHMLIPLDDVDVSELVVWTTEHTAELVGK